NRAVPGSNPGGPTRIPAHGAPRLRGEGKGAVGHGYFTRRLTRRSERVRTTEQIRALEDLATMDAEVKALEEKLTEERGVLNALKESLKRLDERVQMHRGSRASAP